MKRTLFSAWGPAVHGRELPAWAMFDPEVEAPVAGVCRALERKLRLSVVNCCSDGTALDDHGRLEAQHYQLTLGRRMRGGGWSLEGRAWVAVPIPKRDEA